MKTRQYIVRKLQIIFGEMNKKNALLWGITQISATYLFLMPAIVIGARMYVVSVPLGFLYFYVVVWKMPVWFPLYSDD